MKRFSLFVLALAPVFMLGSAAASAQAVLGNPSDAVKAYEPPSFPPVRLSLSPWATAEEYEPPSSPPVRLSLSPPATAYEDEPPALPTPQLSLAPPEVGGDFGLPLLGDEARRAGYELPKPFGFSLIYTDIERDVRVTDVRVGVNGNSVKSVSSFVTLQARTHVNAAVGRFDVYLLPFLNLYGLLGYVNNETHISGTAKLRNGPAIPIDVTTKIEGPVAGLGLTLAGGYKQAFIALDANRSETNLGFDDRFSATIVTLRTGWNGKVYGNPVRLWTGFTYWDTFATARGTSNAGGVRFEADQGPTNPWNVVFGAHVTLHENFDLLFELGTNFNDVRVLTGGVSYRF